jgi:hypothetical protein
MALSCEWRRPHRLRVASSSRSRNGGAEPTSRWTRPAGLGRLAQAHFSPVRSPLRTRVGLLAILHFAHFTCIILATSSLRSR